MCNNTNENNFIIFKDIYVETKKFSEYDMSSNTNNLGEN